MHFVMVESMCVSNIFPGLDQQIKLIFRN